MGDNWGFPPNMVIEKQVKKRWSPSRITISILTAIYFLWCAAAPEKSSFIKGANLAIHEAGHVFFSPFGEFIQFMGGTLLQIIMPVAFVVYFFIKGKYLSGALTVNWIGESMLDISVYIRDAQEMSLPLVGGGIHDWNYILGKLGLLGASNMIAGSVRAAGTLIIIAALVLALHFSRVEDVD